VARVRWEIGMEYQRVTIECLVYDYNNESTSKNRIRDISNDTIESRCSPN
jgi:hypothetical protein